MRVRPIRLHVREIVSSIASLGFCVPVLVDQDGRVLDGWARVESTRQTGIRLLPCVGADHLTAAERRLLSLTYAGASSIGSDARQGLRSR